MYKINMPAKTSIKGKEKMEGETIEAKVRRIVNNKEPITDGAPIVYTERKDGINPAHDIRTDRWDIAIEAMDTVAQVKEHKRTMKVVKDEPKNDGKKDSGAEPLPANSGAV